MRNGRTGLHRTPLRTFGIRRAAALRPKPVNPSRSGKAREGSVLTYLNPPPAPAPVIVTKDVGGLVRDYQAQTAIYRETDREVRVHECHSACTLALSLPNVCVYPDSIFKFHQAYNELTRQTDYGVSDQLFDAYPAAVRARLGTLTRKFKVLRGRELIALGVRDCNAPRIMVAKAHPTPSNGGNPLFGTLASVMSVFDHEQGRSEGRPTFVATRQQTERDRHLPEEALSGAPLPPPRPVAADAVAAQTAQPPSAATRSLAETAAAKPPEARPGSGTAPPPQRPARLATAFTQTLTPIRVPKVIDGAQPILPPQFLAYAVIARLGR